MSVIIRLQGLPWSASAADIRLFFDGLNIPDGGVHIVGGDRGDAFIAFTSDEDARLAMQHSNGYIQNTPVQLFLSSKTEMQNVIAEARDGQPVKQVTIPPEHQIIPPQVDRGMPPIHMDDYPQPDHHESFRDDHRSQLNEPPFGSRGFRDDQRPDLEHYGQGGMRDDHRRPHDVSTGPRGSRDEQRRPPDMHPAGPRGSREELRHPPNVPPQEPRGFRDDQRRGSEGPSGFRNYRDDQRGPSDMPPSIPTGHRDDHRHSSSSPHTVQRGFRDAPRQSERPPSGPSGFRDSERPSSDMQIHGQRGYRDDHRADLDRNPQESGRDMRDHRRSSSDRHGRDGPPGSRDGPTGSRDGLSGLRGGPRDAPRGGSRGGSRDGTRDGPRDGPPGPRDGPPGPRDGPDGPRDGRDGPPGPRDGPPGPRDGPPGLRDGPPGLRGGPPGPRGGPPGPRGGPRDGPQDGPPGSRNGPRDGPPGPRGMRDDSKRPPSDRFGPSESQPIHGEFWIDERQTSEILPGGSREMRSSGPDRRGSDGPGARNYREGPRHPPDVPTIGSRDSDSRRRPGIPPGPRQGRDELRGMPDMPGSDPRGFREDQRHPEDRPASEGPGPQGFRNGQRPPLAPSPAIQRNYRDQDSRGPMPPMNQQMFGEERVQPGILGPIPRGPPPHPGMRSLHNGERRSGFPSDHDARRDGPKRYDGPHEEPPFEEHYNEEYHGEDLEFREESYEDPYHAPEPQRPIMNEFGVGARNWDQGPQEHLPTLRGPLNTLGNMRNRSHGLPIEEPIDPMYVQPVEEPINPMHQFPPRPGPPTRTLLPDPDLPRRDPVSMEEEFNPESEYSESFPEQGFFEEYGNEFTHPAETMHGAAPPQRGRFPPRGAVHGFQQPRHAPFSQPQQQPMVDEDVYIKLRNMPYSVTYSMLRRFFDSCLIPRDGVKLINDNHGRRIGLGFVMFASSDDRARALSKIGNSMDGRVISIMPCSKEEFDNAVDSFTPSRGQTPPKRQFPEPTRSSIIPEKRQFPEQTRPSNITEKRQLSDQIQPLNIPEKRPFSEPNRSSNIPEKRQFPEPTRPSNIPEKRQFPEPNRPSNIPEKRQFPEPEKRQFPEPNRPSNIPEKRPLPEQTRPLNIPEKRQVSEQTRPSNIQEKRQFPEQTRPSNVPEKASPSPKRKRSKSPEPVRSVQKKESRRFIALLREVPYRATKQDVKIFFNNLEIAENGTAVVLDRDSTGKPNGITFVEFATEKDYIAGLRRHKCRIMSRVIDVVEGDLKDMDRVWEKVEGKKRPTVPKKSEDSQSKSVKGSGDSAQKVQKVQSQKVENKKPVEKKESITVAPEKSGSKSSTSAMFCVRLKGLPPTTTRKEIEEFFSGLKISPKGYNPVSKDGQCTGDAFVEFVSAKDCQKACEKDKQSMGKHQISVEAVSKSGMVDELKDLRQKVMSEPTPRVQPPLYYMLGAQNLPFSVSIGEILNFFRGYNPVPESIRLHYTNEGRATGDAVIGFMTESEAHRALRDLNNRMLGRRNVRLYLA